MNRIRFSFLLPLLWMAASCEKRESDLVHTVSGKYIPVSDGVTAIGGDLDGVFSFMIIPIEAAEPVLVKQAMGGMGYEWQGSVRFSNRKQVNFEAKCDRTTKENLLIVGSNKFDLGKGEVFLLASDSSLEQIPDSKAGKKNDPDLAKRLAGIFRERTGKPAAPSESK